MNLRILALLTLTLQVIRAALTNYAFGAGTHQYNQAGFGAIYANDNDHATYYESGVSNDPNDYMLIQIGVAVQIATIFIDGPED